MDNPGASTVTISGLIQDVKAWLQDRSDVSETQPNTEMRPSRWLARAITNLTQKYVFEELRTIGPTVNLGPGLGFQGSNFLYPVSYFLNPGDDYTHNESMTIFLDPPNNTVSYPMDYMQPKAIAPLVHIPGGIPFKYTRYGSNFWFGVQAGSNYQVYYPYQRVHPFTADVVSSPVFMPKDWIEAVTISAAERGAAKLRWNDQSTFLHQKLFGDPEFEMSGGVKGRPGLLAGLMLQQERDEQKSVRQMVPMVQRY